MEHLIAADVDVSFSTSTISAWSSGIDAETLANLAHELRTPIQVITGLIEILREEEPDELGDQSRAIIERLNVNIFDLAQTLDNLLAHALMQAGPVSAIDEELTAEGILAEISANLEAANTGKGLKLIFELDHAPPLIRAPRRLVRSIILNLMLNAIKFTETGAVTLAIRAVAPGEAIEVEVRDTGAGLNPALLQQVSEPFRQLSHSSVRRFRGLGLGLAVVRQNVAALGGALELRTNAAGGATFIVRLPDRGSRRAAAASQRRINRFLSNPLPAPPNRSGAAIRR